jgi:hypothetical protein
MRRCIVALDGAALLCTALLCTALLCTASCNRGTTDPTEGSGAAPEPTPAEQGPADSRHGDLRIGEAFGGTTLSGNAGGPVDASTLNENCVGTVFETPNHRIIIDALQMLTVSATPIGQGVMDLSLLMRTEDGAWTCVDDAATLDPVHAGVFEPGTIDLWVAARATHDIPYELSILPGARVPQPVALGGRFPPPIESGDEPERTTNGTFGGLRLGGTPAPATFTGQTGGMRRAADLGHDCTGYIAHVPDHVIEVTEPLELTLHARSDGDTTLVVQGPQRVWCADDDEALNPVVRTTFPPGRYSVFVGNYEESAELTYALTVSR